MGKAAVPDFELLRGAIDFASAVAGRGHPARLFDPGALPPELRPVHDPVLLGRWLSRALSLLAEPVAEERCGRQRRVHILGTAVFEFDARGRITPYLWSFDAQGRAVLERLSEHEVVAENVPYRDAWVRRLGLGVQRVLVQRCPDQAGLCAAYADWAATEIAKLCWGRAQQAATRYRIAQVLRMDAGAIQQAWRHQHGVGGLLRLSHYNRAVLLQVRIALLDEQAPQLHWLYWMLGDRIAADGEPVQCLKACLLEAGIRPALWRLVHLQGTGWMEDLLDFYDVDGGNAAEVVLDLLRIGQAFGARRAVDPLVVRALMVIGGHPGQRRRCYGPALERLYGLCERMGHLAALATQQERRRLAAEAPEIFNWACERLHEIPKRTLRLATLDWMVDKARGWREEETVKAQSGPRWELHYEVRSPSPRWSLEPLLSAHALWVEARRMHHCADRYVQACEQGRILIFSVQDAATHRHVATIGYEIAGEVIELHQVVGFANSRAGAEVVALANAVLEQLRAQHRETAVEDAAAANDRTLPVVQR